MIFPFLEMEFEFSLSIDTMAKHIDDFVKIASIYFTTGSNYFLEKIVDSALMISLLDIILIAIFLSRINIQFTCFFKRSPKGILIFSFSPNLYRLKLRIIVAARL